MRRRVHWKYVATTLTWIAWVGIGSTAYASGRPERFGEVAWFGHGPVTLVLVPCLGCDWRAWDGFMARNGELYTMAAVTWPGLGATSMPDLESREEPSETPLWDYLDRALENLLSCHGIEDPVLVGHSAAAVSVVRFAADHPTLVRAVVAVDGTITNWDTFGYSRSERRAWAEAQFADVRKRYDNEQAWRRLNSPPKLPDSDRSAFYGRMWLRPPRENVLSYWAEWLKVDVGTRMAELDTPLLGLYAIGDDEDAGEVRRKKLARFERAGAKDTTQVAFVEGVGHSIWEYDMEAFEQHLKRFLDSIEKRSSGSAPRSGSTSSSGLPPAGHQQAGRCASPR